MKNTGIGTCNNPVLGSQHRE